MLYSPSGGECSTLHGIPVAGEVLVAAERVAPLTLYLALLGCPASRAAFAASASVHLSTPFQCSCDFHCPRCIWRRHVLSGATVEAAPNGFSQGNKA